MKIHNCEPKTDFCALTLMHYMYNSYKLGWHDGTRHSHMAWVARPVNVPTAESRFTLDEPLTKPHEGGEERLQPVARSPLDRLYAWVASQ